MQEAVQIFQVIISILLILSILSQQRSAGLSATFGGGGGFHVSKRGAEKILFRMTIVFALLFVGSSILYLFV
ncbi:preprotein translocase subunit SecG [Candidatus Peregrinibacteria bacterium]|nr:preprotein translocase subunit SecG [Candidatus Peregrinibacteria bacterium]